MEQQSKYRILYGVFCVAIMVKYNTCISLDGNESKATNIYAFLYMVIVRIVESIIYDMTLVTLSKKKLLQNCIF